MFASKVGKARKFRARALIVEPVPTLNGCQAFFEPIAKILVGRKGILVTNFFNHTREVASLVTQVIFFEALKFTRKPTPVVT